MSVRRQSQPWPYKAAAVADTLAIALAAVGTHARSMDKQMLAIDHMAALGVDAVRNGNVLLAQQIFLDIQQRTATVRHTAATILSTAGTASAALAAARVGEYEG
jgi:hypothetical protein